MTSHYSHITCLAVISNGILVLESASNSVDVGSAIHAGEERAKKEEEEESKAQLARVEYFSSIFSADSVLFHFYKC